MAAAADGVADSAATLWVPEADASVCAAATLADAATAADAAAGIAAL
ncbi:hypothetical protein AB4Y38_31280 [Paraburkholderia sp. EG285A]